MSTTTNPRKAITEAQTDADDDSFTRASWNYGYIGQDNEGRHHHVDRKLERIVVTEDTYEESMSPSQAAPRYTVEGPILHAQELVNEHTLARWVDFVAEESCGWDDRPISAADQLGDVIGGGV